MDGSEGVIFFASGVFHYLTKIQVKNLVLEIEKRFPGARLVFDTVGTLGHNLMMKNVLKNLGITDVSGYFHVDNVEKELGNWSPNIRISYRGYMLGYYNLNTTGITAAILS